jgi:hypothetical protein
MPRVAVELPQLDEDAVRHMAEPKDGDVLTPTLRAAGTQVVSGLSLCQAKPND